VGGNYVMVNGRLDERQKELFDWIKMTRLRCKSGRCGARMKVAVQERVAVQGEGKN